MAEIIVEGQEEPRDTPRWTHAAILQDLIDRAPKRFSVKETTARYGVGRTVAVLISKAYRSSALWPDLLSGKITIYQAAIKVRKDASPTVKTKKALSKIIEKARSGSPVELDLVNLWECLCEEGHIHKDKEVLFTKLTLEQRGE